MRINIKGNDITPDKIAAALAACERDYGLRIKGATIYVRFENAAGQTVDPLQDGEEFSRDFVFQRREVPNWKSAPKEPEPPSEPALQIREIYAMCERSARRMLSGVEMQALAELAKTMPIGRSRMEQALGAVMQRRGRFDVNALVSVLRKDM